MSILALWGPWRLLLGRCDSPRFTSTQSTRAHDAKRRSREQAFHPTPQYTSKLAATILLPN